MVFNFVSGLKWAPEVALEQRCHVINGIMFIERLLKDRLAYNNLKLEAVLAKGERERALAYFCLLEELVPQQVFLSLLPFPDSNYSILQINTKYNQIQWIYIQMHIYCDG